MSVKRYRWVILFVSYLCMLNFAFPLQSLPPILTLIIKELHLSHGAAGLLMSSIALPPVLLAILAGSLSDRWGPFGVGVISLVFVITGTLVFAIGGSFFFAILGRVLAGVGAAGSAIIAAQILSEWFRERELGMAMGIFNTAMPIGTIICFTTFGKLGESFGWRMPMFVTLIVGALGLIVFATLYRGAPEQPSKTTHRKGGRTGLLSSLAKTSVLIWLMGLCWMWFNASIISFSTFAPDFFISKGYTIGSAGLLTSLLMWGSLGLSPVIGRSVDRIGRNNVFIAVGGVMIATAIFLITRGINFLFAMIIMAVAVPFVPAPLYALLPKISRSGNLGLAFGILTMFASIGMLFGPYVTGLIRDQTGSYAFAFTLLSILALLATLTALVSRTRMPKV